MVTSIILLHGQKLLRLLRSKHESTNWNASYLSWYVDYLRTNVEKQVNDTLPPIEWLQPDVTPIVNGHQKMYFVTENGALLRCFTNPDMIVEEQ
jgi:hypothetical protein